MLKGSERPLNKVSRRAFLKASIGSVTSLALFEASFDSISQSVRGVLDIQHDSMLANIIEGIKKIYPEVNQWSNATEWGDSILSSFERNNLKASRENICIVLTLIRSSSGFRGEPRSVDFIPSPKESFFRNIGIKSPKTSGPLETEIQYVMEETGKDYNTVLALLIEKETGLYYGVKYLQKIIDEYADITDTSKRLGCIFADYNAGIYSSRKAGLQAATNKLQEKQLYLDGILGHETVVSIATIFQREGISITFSEIKNDIQSQKMNTGTPTYRAICSLLNIHHLEPEIPETKVQGITGFLKEHLTGVRTSRDYAQARINEYETIMGIIRGESENI